MLRFPWPAAKAEIGPRQGFYLQRCSLFFLIFDFSFVFTSVEVLKPRFAASLAFLLFKLENYIGIAHGA